MDPVIPFFRIGNPATRRALNSLVQTSRAVANMVGDGIILVQKTDTSISLSLRIDALKGKLAQDTGSGDGGGGLLDLETAKVVRDLKYDDPDRVYPSGCTWGPEGEDWPLEDQEYYIVRSETDSTAVYVDSSSSVYVTGDYCLFEVLADSVSGSAAEPFAEEGYGYELKYQCTADSPGTSGPFDYNDWELVDSYNKKQWKVKFPMQETAEVDMRDYIPWFDVDDILPIFDEESDHVIWQTFIHVGAGGSKSLSWNQEEGRAMGVFR